jgi:hypothetical protein
MNPFSPNNLSFHYQDMNVHNCLTKDLNYEFFLLIQTPIYPLFILLNNELVNRYEFCSIYLMLLILMLLSSYKIINNSLFYYIYILFLLLIIILFIYKNLKMQT